MPRRREPHSGDGVVSTGWLAANSMFGSGERRTRRAGARRVAGAARPRPARAILRCVASTPAHHRWTHLIGSATWCFCRSRVRAAAAAAVPRRRRRSRSRSRSRRPPSPCPSRPRRRNRPPPPSRRSTAPVMTNAARAAGVSGRSLHFRRAGRRRRTGQRRRVRDGQRRRAGNGGGFGGGVYRPGAGIINPKFLIRSPARPTRRKRCARRFKARSDSRP